MPRRVIGLEGGAACEGSRFARQRVPSTFDVVEPRVRIEGGHASENRMCRILGRFHSSQRQFSIVEVAVMRDPPLPKELSRPRVIQWGMLKVVLRISKCVRRGSKADHWSARLGKFEDGCKLFVWEGSKPRKEHQHVRRRENVGPWDVVQRVGIDVTFRVEAIEDGGSNTMVLSEDRCEQRKRFLAPIFLITGNEDDVRRFRLGGRWPRGVRRCLQQENGGQNNDESGDHDQKRIRCGVRSLGWPPRRIVWALKRRDPKSPRTMGIGRTAFKTRDSTMEQNPMPSHSVIRQLLCLGFFIGLFMTPALAGGTSPITGGESSDSRTILIDQVESRRWIGSAWQPSRLQDWRLEAGRLINDDSRLPIRTAHVLTLRLEPSSPTAALVIRVDVRPVGMPVEAGAFAGVLIGAGNSNVDPRLSALVQQVPAPDGGLLAVVDASTTPRLIDFSTEKKGGFSWSLPNKIKFADLQAVAGEQVEFASGVTTQGRMTLILQITPKDGRFDIDLEIRDGDAIFGMTTARGLSADQIDGGLALVSHRELRKDGIGWAFDGLELQSRDLDRWIDETDHSWGPVLGVTYTLDRQDEGIHALKLNALFPPVSADDLGEVALEFQTRDRAWRRIATGSLEDLSFTVPFQVDDLEEYLGRRYRVVGSMNGVPYEWSGEIHAPPTDRELRIASLNCVKNVTAHSAWNRAGVWFPHEDLTERVAAHDADFFFFAGDQIYEGDINGVDRRKIVLDYHTKYHRWLRAFAPLVRDRPSVIIPDDHDVYHGNIWGAGGILAKAKDGLTVQDAGGYKLSAEVVNAIHRTQVGNLPDRMIPGPIGQGIEPYATRIRYGPADFAVVADRMWKDSASVMVPEGKVRNGWFRNPDFDPKDSDVAAAAFLGPTQEAFLSAWATDRDPASPRKIVLSQTPWVNVATLPPGRDDGVVPGLKIHAAGEYAKDDMPAADTDSGGWPQSARTRAVRSLQAADALHLCGDQHLGSLVQYGVDTYRDGTFAFTPPAVANTWPRRWMPIDEGGNRWEGAPRYAGDFEDGFGNRMTVFAVTNPEDRGIEPRRLFDLSPGYGIIEVDPVTGDLLLEAWPRWADPDDPGAQYAGWPFEVPARR